VIYLGYCVETNCYLFQMTEECKSDSQYDAILSNDQANTIIEVKATSEVQALERARQVVFGMA
jgi:hypothetical protein